MVKVSSFYKKVIKTFALFFTLLSLVFANKPDLFLLKTYNKSQDVIGWVMSEKFDGIRGFWNGKQLLTRGGKIINTPKWFIENYPPFAIDGELWTKRGDFENISSIVRQKTPDKRWQNISHQIFEVPNQQGGLLARLAVLKTYLSKHKSTPIRLIKQTPITQRDQLKIFLNQVIKQGGEGVVVRNPATPYQTGRLASALKVKLYFDTECTVTKILSGFTDIERQNPPKIGDEITFKYYGFTNKGKFRFPVFLRVKPN